MGESPHIHTRFAAAIGLLCLACLASAVRLHLTVRGMWFSPEGDEAARYERRFDELVSLLPARGTICYVDRGTGTDLETQDYYLTQYALSPRIVIKGSDCQFLIANLGGGAEISHAIPPEFDLRREFANGLTLYERQERGDR
jgi:hypothetical protein